jgi:hypothetical protein
MGILILGLILIIVGVGATYVYDHFGNTIKSNFLEFKVNFQTQKVRKEKAKKPTEMEKRKLETQEVIKSIHASWDKNKSASKTLQELDEDFLKKFKAHVEHNQNVLKNSEYTPQPEKKKIVRKKRSPPKG